MTRPLKVGVQLPEVEREVRWPEVARMARLIEDAGFDSIWVGDHLLYDRPPVGPRGPWEAWTQLAAIAAITTRVEIGPLVACAGFHEPAMLAKLAATVDEVSGGRLIVGLGAGWNRTEFEAFGYPDDRRVERFEESFEIVRRLLAGEHVSFVGRHHAIDGAVLLPAAARPGGPPLMVGSSRPRMLAATIGHVRYWNAWWTDFANAPTGIGALRAIVDSACEAAGRDSAEVERTVAVLVAPLGDAARLSTPGREQAPAIVGSPAQIADVLARFAAEGIAHVQLVLDPITIEGIEAAATVLGALDTRH